MMLASTTQHALRRSLLTVPSTQLRLLSSLVPPTLHGPSTNRKKENESQPASRSFADATATTTTAAPVEQAKQQETTTKSKSSSPLLDRFVVTAEVTVSKIFPAGLGWQSASLWADHTMGYASDSASFALTTGLGDALGVLAGHCLYYTLKKSTGVDPHINLTREWHTGVLLGSAAFMSGTAWQPLVNALQGANLTFASVLAGTWVGCGVAFYTGLRVARTVLSARLPHIAPPTYENSQTDAALSVAIGGATGCFVGTDAAYLPEQNFLLGAVGILDTTPDVTGCLLAGTSTSLGFCAAQSTLNMVYPAGKCWND